jgi:hypothetical protein
MNSNSFPIFVYKIVETGPPEPLPFVLRLSELDIKDGLIHLSDGTQVAKTADLFFGKACALWFLKISTAAVVQEGFLLEWASGSPGCVHLHGKNSGEQARSSLGQGLVLEVRSFERHTVS